VIVGSGTKCDEPGKESSNAVRWGLATENGTVIFPADMDCYKDSGGGGLTLGVWLDGVVTITGNNEWMDGNAIWSD